MPALDNNPFPLLIRVVALATRGPGSSDHQVRVQQQKLQVQSRLLLSALRLFYASLGSFAAAGLISAIGSALAFYDWHFAFRVAAVVGLAVGCRLMVRETGGAVQTLAEETALARSR